MAAGAPTITIRDIGGDSQRITTFPQVQVYLRLIIADPFFVGPASLMAGRVSGWTEERERDEVKEERRKGGIDRD